MSKIQNKDTMKHVTTKNKTLLKANTEKRVSLSKKPRDGVDAEFMKWVEDFMTEHDDVLRELAKR